MGLYDRDYVREQPQGFFLGSNRSVVTNLILINVGIFLVDLVFFNRHLNEYMALQANLFTHPWNFWQLLTYGFAHDAGQPGTPIVLGNFAHVGFNMFGLWLFGRDVESIYGRKEFLRIYMSLLVLCGLSWVIFQNALLLTGRMGNASVVIGASGAVLGIMVLYVTHYPRRVFYFWGVLPVPVWVLCGLYLLQDLAGFGGALEGSGEPVAYEVHLSGALFAFIYRRTGWNLGRMIPQRWSRGWRLSTAARLKVHQPPVEDEPDTSRREENLNRRVDEILAKISSTGEASLTREERRILEDASRRYQQRRR